MSASKDLFLRIREPDYLEIPEWFRERYLRDKIYSESVNDFEELMQDETYARLHKEKKEITERLNERQYQLREQKRNGNNRKD